MDTVVSPGHSSVDEVLLSKSHGTQVRRFHFTGMLIGPLFLCPLMIKKKDRIVKNCRKSSLFTLRVDTGTLQSEASLSFDAEGGINQVLEIHPIFVKIFYSNINMSVTFGGAGENVDQQT